MHAILCMRRHVLDINIRNILFSTAHTRDRIYIYIDGDLDKTRGKRTLTKASPTGVVCTII